MALINCSIDYENGESATYAGVETIEVADSKEPFSGKMTVLLKDGSISNEAFEGEATSKGGPGQVIGNGMWKLVSGTGKFANLSRGGKFNWAVDGDKYYAKFCGP